MSLVLKQLARVQGSGRASEWRDTMSFSRVTSRSRVLVLITRAQLNESMLPGLCVNIHLKLRSFIEGQAEMLL